MVLYRHTHSNSTQTAPSEMKPTRRTLLRLQSSWPLSTFLLCLSLTLLSSSNIHPVSAGCAEGHYCIAEVDVSLAVPCVPGQYCSGEDTGRLCAKGFYCPDPTQEIVCPNGYYCPPASIAPRPCSPLAECEEGGHRYFHWGALVLLMITLPLIVAAPYFYHKANDYYNKTLRNSELIKSHEDLSASLKPVPAMDIEFTNLQAVIKVKGVEKVILQDVTGHFKPGRLIACMGPSGAGKSSLINVLTGEVGHKSGSITTRIAGCVEDDMQRARRQSLIGVVPQADIMISCLTPRDILTHAAFSRLPADWSNQQKYERVNDTIKVLGLEKVQHTPVGDEDVRGVSGGEKKRCSIGIELVNNPSLLILDEPTTGLDATSSATLIQTLKAITKQQTSVVTVLHQPRNEIFRALDDLLLLAPGGRTVYFGPAHLSQAYFESIGYVCDRNTNPSDFFIDVIAGKAGSPFQNSQSQDASSSYAQQADDMKRPQPGAKEFTTAAEIQAYLANEWKNEAGEKFRRSHCPDDSERKGDKSPRDESKKFLHVVKQPSLSYLTYLYAYRGMLQLVRSIGTLQLELFMHILAGCVIGMAFVEDNWFIPPIDSAYLPFCPEPFQTSCQQDPVRNVLDLTCTYTVMAVGLVAAVIGNRNYGQELVILHRESSAGINSTAYFWGKAISEIPLIVVYAFLYCVSYVLVSSPSADFNKFYTTMLLFEFTMFGAGYVASLLLQGENALLLSAIGALLGGLATDNDPIKSLCWARWVSEALFIAEARIDLLPSPQDKLVQTWFDLSVKFDIHNFATDILALVIYGFVLRFIAHALVIKKCRK